MTTNDTTNVPASDPVAPDAPYREAMTHLIGERWEAVCAALPAAIDGTDPEGVHDVRVASRRLRAAMDVAVGAFPKPWYRRLHRTAKQITAALGDVRDRDVLLGYWAERRGKATATERAGIDLLIERLERERTAAREEMMRFLAGIDPDALATETRRRFPRAGASDGRAGADADESDPAVTDDRKTKRETEERQTAGSVGLNDEHGSATRDDETTLPDRSEIEAAGEVGDTGAGDTPDIAEVTQPSDRTPAGAEPVRRQGKDL
ncbi:MAG: hypothetical protein AVDCRST_MAG70-1893 [uncultured Thermomicrobiales bacterium]|uniref:CHAD domain-containing protein n=1 Tax=uncultured Thermomicrobiales bacterium TaxID=1645740 RepID=A0A6J4UZ42_9BACT|nr:MAG: hypothetical protein AVDCRST_MAG70-1893 [uncultured Thermomicrobiales bacterium]